MAEHERGKSVWFYAEAAGRNYITPEDIGDAINDDIDKQTLWGEVLEALGDKLCEDTSCCAFVAWKFEKRQDDDRSDA